MSLLSKVFLESISRDISGAGISLSMIDTTWYQAGPKFQDVTSSCDEDDSEREFRNVFCIKDVVPSAGLQCPSSDIKEFGHVRMLVA